jgi:hypothetical protein
VGGTSEGRGLEGSAQKSLLVGLVGPSAAQITIRVSSLYSLVRCGESYLSRRCVRSLRAALSPLGFPLFTQSPR